MLYACYSETSITSGQTNSECFIPNEYEGADRLFITTFSGECAPGPGFLVESVMFSKMETPLRCKIYSFFLLNLEKKEHLV